MTLPNECIELRRAMELVANFPEVGSVILQQRNPEWSFFAAEDYHVAKRYIKYDLKIWLKLVSNTPSFNALDSNAPSFNPLEMSFP